jgi:pyruvate/2-oxoglutarate/acetoin dehydrogenase E1 component
MTTVLKLLNDSLFKSMEADKRIYLLGEDILDPYGGAFKVTKGLSTRFPDRVLTTPISEQAIVGVAIGMALRGLRPVVEIMFGDFITLTMDQIINHASKFRWVYNNQVSVPIVLRTPMGGRRGYGPTHSQSLEKLFLGIPGLRVVAPNTLGNPGLLLEGSIAENDPVIFVEHKLLYTSQKLEKGEGELLDWKIEQIGERYPTFRIHFSSNSQITIATYGYNFELVRKAALELLMEEEIFSEIILFSQLSPFNISPLIESLKKTSRLLTVEEGSKNLGWGAEVVARVAEMEIGKIKLKRIGALDFPIANSNVLEDNILPSKQRIKQAIKELLEK